MSDDERRSFDNLLLLCTGHHKLVDRFHPERYQAKELRRWKSEREGGQAEELRYLPSITEDSLGDLIATALCSYRPQRLAKAELSLGVIAGNQLVKVPPDKFSWLSETNPDLGVPVLITTLRNQGDLPVFVESLSLRLDPVGSRLMGENDFPLTNPHLPARLEAGESASWCNDLALIARIAHFFRSQKYAADFVRAAVDLGSGESIESDPVSTSVFIPS